MDYGNLVYSVLLINGQFASFKIISQLKFLFLGIQKTCENQCVLP